MPELTAWEQEWVRLQQELRDHPGIEVLKECRGPVLIEEPRDFGEAAVVPLSEWLPRFRGIGSQWRTVGPGPAVTGEFYLDFADEGPRDYVSTIDSDEAEVEERIGRELRVIDSAPYTGTGSCGAIRPVPGNSAPEVWFDDHTRGLWKMDLDYRGYLNQLRLTKGAFGWQHLFTQAPLEDWEFGSTARRLATMLDVLPRLFPEHDYGPLRERLQSRPGTDAPV